MLNVKLTLLVQPASWLHSLNAEHKNTTSLFSEVYFQTYSDTLLCDQKYFSPKTLFP